MTLGVPPRDYPHDPDDLARCLRLLERFPAWKRRMHKMGEHCPYWASLLTDWSRIRRSFVREAGGSIPARFVHWSAPKTYALMRGSILRVDARRRAKAA